MRLPDWEARLHEYLDSVAAEPFAYGKHDCALFVAGVVNAMTGHDFGAPFRGRYKSAAGAVRALRLYGAGNLESTLTAALGFPVHPSRAGRGDIVTDGISAGVCMGGVAKFATDIGMTDLPRSAWRQAWVVHHV
jgi:hypothetical protein